MTCCSFPEPDVASSDATNMECTLRRDGGSYVVNGKKWWSSGMLFSSLFKEFIVEGLTHRHPREEMSLVT